MSLLIGVGAPAARPLEMPTIHIPRVPARSLLKTRDRLSGVHTGELALASSMDSGMSRPPSEERIEIARFVRSSRGDTSYAMYRPSGDRLSFHGDETADFITRTVPSLAAIIAI